MIASLAVVEAISKTCGITATIKWPNDVLIGDRKVAGILVETSYDQAGCMAAIIGIGINVNGRITQLVGTESEPQQSATELVAKATTLEAACGHPVSREMLISHLLRQLEMRYLALQQEAQDPVASACGTSSRLIREQWRDQLSTLGRIVEIRQGETVISGIAEDVDDSGELLLRSHSGEQISITWGDVGYPTE
jgi:BirA family biotin operon repressor/biotin-[acetyl-CoA-carboxylase] ligase